MSDRDTFGPRLRSERERRGISIETIVTVTKVGADLWLGLERNDFSKWPSGIFARAFVRDYAKAVGLDADEIVDEFCRLFPNGDRRAARIIKPLTIEKPRPAHVASGWRREHLPPRLTLAAPPRSRFSGPRSSGPGSGPQRGSRPSSTTACRPFSAAPRLERTPSNSCVNGCRSCLPSGTGAPTRRISFPFCGGRRSGLLYLVLPGAISSPT
jgi:helix-turn-helix protein